MQRLAAPRCAALRLVAAVCTTTVAVAWVGMGRASPCRGEPSWLHQLLYIDPGTLVCFVVV